MKGYSSMKTDGSPSFPVSSKENESERFNLVILFSGGADSVLMLHMAKFMGYNPYCVLIDYQQLHYDEVNFSISYFKKNDIPYRLVKLHDLQIQSGLTGAGEQGRFEGVHEMHVSSRNLMFVGIAASIAEDMGVDTIWYGADMSDFVNKFPDCMQTWIGTVNKVLKINGPKPIKLEAPMLGLTKESILKVLKSMGIEENEMFSGYGGLGIDTEESCDEI
jgi:7-cyano-7-deazaguanine synthase